MMNRITTTLAAAEAKYAVAKRYNGVCGVDAMDKGVQNALDALNIVLGLGASYTDGCKTPAEMEERTDRVKTLLTNIELLLVKFAKQ